MKVITYQTATGRNIDLTRRQIDALQSAGEWPRTLQGEEYCQVSHGLHYGNPAAEGSDDIRSILDEAK